MRTLTLLITICLACTACWPDETCGATERDGKLSVRYYFEAEYSLVPECRAEEDVFSMRVVDELPTQLQLADVIRNIEPQIFAVGDHDVEPGSYVQCTTIEGGHCTGLTVENGVVAVRSFIGPGPAITTTSQDVQVYENLVVELTQ
jgi:hypothetical protein